MRFSKKIAAVSIVASVTLVGAGALAYWTTTGSGEGSGTAAAENGTLVLHAFFDDGIYPGGEEDVSFTADNAGATDLRVQTIHLDSVQADDLDCDVSDFTMADVDSDTTVLAGALDQGIGGTGSLVFANDDLASQDACKGALITLNVSSD